MEIKELTKQKGYLATIAAAYVAALLFLLFGVDMGIFHVIQHPAFLPDGEFLMEWLPQPGGLSVYLSLFVEQFFGMTFWGGFALVVEIFITALLLVRLMEKIFDVEYGAKSLLWIAPLFVSMVCINNVYFDFSSITRLTVMLALMNLLYLLPKDSKLYGAASAVVAVATYHFCGPTFLYGFCATQLVLLAIKKISFLDFVWALGVTAFYPALMYRFVLPLTPSLVFYYPVATRTILEQYQPVIVMFFILVPLVVLILHFVGKIKWADADAVKSKKKKTVLRPSVCFALTIAVMIGVIVGVFRMHDSRRERFSTLMLYKMELADWQYIIDHAEDFPGYDRNTNFCYDLALAMTGQMSNRLFEYPQLLGNEALTIEEPLAGGVCYPSSSMYYQIGQIPESLHYAYESIIYYKHSPYVLRRIIDCLIIANRYAEAEVFLKQLDRDMLAHQFVKDRRKFIAGKDNTKLTKEFVQSKRINAVKYDYIMTPPYRNYEQLFLANKKNQAAVDYLLCYCLLEMDLENFFNVLQESNYDKNHLPKHYQEAVAIYKATSRNPRKYATEVTIDPLISRRFVEFGTLCNRSGSNAYKVVKQNFADTYWIYFTFENPMSKNFSLKKNHQE
ncbi:MAG: hypothetical protein II075_08860 [Bacteroidales bacterium]|nr:hypothetical protein [Bacteroidales bacterium]